MMIYLEPYKKYAVFEGRASRREFWTYKLFVCLFFIALIGASAIFASLHLYVLSSLMGIAMVLFSIFTIIPGIAVTFRRLHDTNRSGWFLLLFFIPVIGSLVLLITFCLKSTPGANQYGPHPYGLSDTKKEGR